MSGKDDFLSLLVRCGMLKTFNRVCKKYNELLLEMDGELMEKIKADKVPELTDEQSQKMKEEIFAKIKEKEISDERYVRFLKAIFEDE